MADIYEKDLALNNTPSIDDFLRLVGEDDDISYRTLVSDVAKAIIETYASSVLGGKAQTIQDAFSDVQVNLTDITDAEIAEIITGVTPSESGFITNEEIDEIIGNVPAASAIFLLNAIYPVGTYYETSNSEFDPNTSFSGTWELDPDYGVMTINDEAPGGSVDAELASVLTNAGYTDISSTNPVYRWHRTA